MAFIEHAASTVLVEAFDEAVGRSKRNWALMLVAFVLGAVAVAALMLRYRNRTEILDHADGSDTARASEPLPTAADTSAWSRRRARVVHSETLMRARVGRAASRLNPRQRRRDKLQEANAIASEHPSGNC
jgi:hypothetical protein